MKINEINEFVREKRHESGISAQKVAEKTGVSRRAVVYWESGKRKMSYENAEKLLSALGYHIEIVKDE